MDNVTPFPLEWIYGCPYCGEVFVTLHPDGIIRCANPECLGEWLEKWILEEENEN